MKKLILQISNSSSASNASNQDEIKARASLRGQLVTAIVEKLNPEADLDGETLSLIVR